MQTRRRALRGLAAGTAACLGWPALAQNDRRIVLGQSAPLSGPAAQLGLQMNAGARIFFDRLNAEGGVGGRTVQLRALDDGYEPDRCRAHTEALIDKDGVFALFGYVGTPTSLAAVPLANKAGVPFFGPFTGAEALREPFSKWVFHVRGSYYDETELIVRQLTHLGLQRIAVFRQNDSYGQAGLDDMVRALKSRNLAPTAVGLVERNSVDVEAAVKTIMREPPDAVVQISAYKSCAAFVRAARQASYGGSFYNVSFVGTQALADELGTQATGVMISQVMPFPFSTTTAIAREYLEAVRKAGNGATANYSSMEGYLCAKVFADGLRRAGGNPTRDALVGGLESLTRHDVGGYSVNFSPRNHRASTFAELSMLSGDGKVRR